MLCVAPAVAADGVTVELPPGEGAVAWRGPLELAGLSLAPEAGLATVRIEEAGGLWRVAVVDGPSVTVPAPTSEAAREEVALLARALARSLAPLERPDGTLTRPVPPRPPRPAPPVRRAPPADLPPVDPVLTWDPLGALDPVVVVRAPVAEPLPTPPRAPRTPPIAIALGTALRPGTAPALAADLRVDALGADGWAGGVELGATLPRSVDVAPAPDVGVVPPDRRVWDLRAGAVASFAPSPRLRAEALAGAAFRAFRHERRAIGEVLVPFVGGGVALSVGGRLSLGARLRGLVDLRPVTLVDEAGAARRLAPVEVGLALVIGSRGSGDPDRRVPTPPGR